MILSITLLSFLSQNHFLISNMIDINNFNYLFLQNIYANVLLLQLNYKFILLNYLFSNENKNA